jgi:hypothetical protein
VYPSYICHQLMTGVVKSPTTWWFSLKKSLQMLFKVMVTVKGQGRHYWMSRPSTVTSWICNLQWRHLSSWNLENLLFETMSAVIDKSWWTMSKLKLREEETGQTDSCFLKCIVIATT